MSTIISLTFDLLILIISISVWDCPLGGLGLRAEHESIAPIDKFCNSNIDIGDNNNHDIFYYLPIATSQFATNK